MRGGGAMLAELRSKLQERKKQQEAAAPPGAAGALGALEGIVPLPELELPESLRSIRSPPPTFPLTLVPTPPLICTSNPKPHRARKTQLAPLHPPSPSITNQGPSLSNPEGQAGWESQRRLRG